MADTHSQRISKGHTKTKITILKLWLSYKSVLTSCAWREPGRNCAHTTWLDLIEKKYSTGTLGNKTCSGCTQKRNNSTRVGEKNKWEKNIYAEPVQRRHTTHGKGGLRFSSTRDRLRIRNYCELISAASASPLSPSTNSPKEQWHFSTLFKFTPQIKTWKEMIVFLLKFSILFSTISHFSIQTPSFLP